MITVYYKNDPEAACVIRPTPFVAISFSAQRNKVGSFGGSYDITLTGTIIDDEGSPIIASGLGGSNDTGGNTVFVSGTFVHDYKRPASQIVGLDQKLRSILQKQNSLRELFALDGQKIEILPISNDPGNGFNSGGSDEPIITCYPTLQSINFEEGIYVNTCRYTISLKTDLLFDQAGKVLIEGCLGNTFTAPSGNITSFYGSGARSSASDIIDTHGGFIEDFSETWSIESDDTKAVTTGNGGSNPVSPSIVSLKSYRLTRNVSATGKVVYAPSGASSGGGTTPNPNAATTIVRHEAWEQAKRFIRKKIAKSTNGYDEYPRYDIDNIFAKDIMNISGVFGGYNHTRTENIDKATGQYSITDTWLLSSGTAYENYNMSITSSIDAPFVSVSMQGTIQGLSTITPSGAEYGGTGPSGTMAYINALKKYHEISNSGQFGLTCPVYKRADNAVAPVLNAQPKSLTLSINEFTGEITYNLEFNNRPMNFISGVLSEMISINDTYPGDVFAVIPVLGRQTGPVLQYIGGRTEYQRSVNIEFTVDYTDIPYGRERTTFLLSKPSLNEPIRGQINSLITALSPASEPGIRKYFLSPPGESWNPKEGRYSLALNWTYELDH